MILLLSDSSATGSAIQSSRHLGRNSLISCKLLPIDGVAAVLLRLWMAVSALFPAISGLPVAISVQSVAVSMNEMRVSWLYPVIAFMSVPISALSGAVSSLSVQVSWRSAGLFGR